MGIEIALAVTGGALVAALMKCLELSRRVKDLEKKVRDLDSSPRRGW